MTDVVVTTSSGTSEISAADEFTYEVAPTVSAVSPIAGALGGGTSVTVTGTSFTGATGVSFGAAGATSFTVGSATQLTAVSPSGAAGTIDVVVSTPSGSSAISAADEFTYEVAPTIGAISPVAGPGRGDRRHHHRHRLPRRQRRPLRHRGRHRLLGRLVHLHHRQFPGRLGRRCRGHHRHDFGGPNLTGPADQFTYQGSPTISSVSPLAGPLGGGSTVTITGTGFLGASAVEFGGVAGTNLTVGSATQATATAPAEAAGTVDVTVATLSGTSANSTADHFTYEVAPTVTAISPVAGPLTGSTSVTITGTGFTGATGVSFGSSAAISYVVNSPTSIGAVSPAEGAGTVDVRVTTPIGTSGTSAADQFTYEVAPAVSAVSPPAGPWAAEPP